MGGARHERTDVPPTTATVDTNGARPEAPRELMRLRAGLGNRGFARYARMLARRDDDTSITVYLAGTPPPVHAAERATPENEELAKYIDEMDKLGREELRKRRELEAAAAVSPTETSHRQHELTLEAIEYIAKRRGLGPMFEWRYPDRPSQSPTTMRFNVRVMIEQGIRETGSFKKALDRLPDNDVIEPFANYWRSEGKQFAWEFKRQAYLTVKRMLEGSDKALDQLLVAYGIPVEAARPAAWRVREGADLDTEAAGVVRSASIAEHVDDDANVNRRKMLAVRTEQLKKLQQRVAEAHIKLNKADMNRPADRSDPRWKTAYDAHVELVAAQRELQSMWIAAERLHPVLAAFRRGRDIEKVELGALDSHKVEDQMKAVMKEVLPKIADVDRAKDRILRRGADTSPLAIPTVVALTRANMFIPKDTLRDGIANDLVDEATGADSWLATIGVVALALVSLLPGGAIIAGIAGTALAAYDATKQYDEYTKQKTFANTNLDIARSLSTQEPSLTHFAVSLVSLGFEAIPLAMAFNEIRRMKALVTAGEDTTAAVRELNALGKTHDAPNLGDQCLNDIRNEQKGAKAASEAEGAGSKAHEPVGGGTVGKATKTTAAHVPRVPVGSAYKTVDEFRAAVKKMLQPFNGRALNEEWMELAPVLKEARVIAANQDLIKDLERVHQALRDPDLIEKVMVEVWERAALDGITTEEALVRMVGRGKKLPVIKRDVLTPTRFKQVLEADTMFLDNAFTTDFHGAYSHAFQELVVAKALGGMDAARNFRHLIAAAVNPAEGKVKIPFFGKVWDALYDSYSAVNLNSPEGLGPILHQYLGLPGRVRTP
ncbi:MAG TPA: hypothetical protein VH418_20580 [Solirubrobacteraceae bacterium]